MLEQQTIQQGAHLAEQFGPSATVLILIAIGWVFYARNVNRSAVKPVEDMKEKFQEIEKRNSAQDKEIEKLRDSKGRILDEMNHLRVELERRVTFQWAEDKLMPQIKELTKDVNRLALISEKWAANMEAQREIGKQMNDSITTLANAVKMTGERLARLEEKVAS